MLMDFVRLLRMHHYYKNLLIFLVPFFGGLMLNSSYYIPLLVGFVSLCFVSSANYIINDIKDAEYDRNNPEKSGRPLASGRIKVWQAVMFSAVLLCISLFLAYSIGIKFLGIVVLLFVLTQMYTFYFKNVPFADINFISVNFLLRAISGSFVVNLQPSQWLILIAYFFALYLALTKRRTEMELENHSNARSVLSKYDKKSLDGMLSISMAIIILLYALYTFDNYSELMFITIPFVLYVLFKLYSYTYSEPEIGRKIYKIFLKLDVLFSAAVVALIFFINLYLTVHF